jgi:hypothetical protein
MIYKEHELTIILFQTCTSGMYVITITVVVVVAVADTNTDTLLFGGSVRCCLGDAFHNHVR